jgi:class 3 adenylate cyclase
LVVGDWLIRLGETDLRGVGSIGFFARVYEEADPKLQVPVSFLRAGKHGETVLSLFPHPFPWRPSLLTLPFVGIAVLVLLRLPGSRLARMFFLASMAYSFHWTFFVGGPRVQTYAWVAIVLCSGLLVYPLSLRLVLLFPEEVVPTGARMPIWPWLFAVYGPIVASRMFGVPLPPAVGLRAYFLVNAAFITTLLVLLTRNFRRSGPVGRRQVKWVVYGFYLGTGPVLLADMVSVLDPSLSWLHEIAMIFPALIPLCTFIAIVRFNLFDIDRLISATAAYTALSVFLLAGALTVIPRLSQAASILAGVEPAFGQMILSFLLAALVVPGQRYLRPQIERLFFAERHALEQGVEHLLRELSACEGPQALLTLAGEQLDTLLRPEGCVIYGRAGEAYAPVFMRGRVVPPAVEARSLLIGVLQAKTTPIDVEYWRQRTAREVLRPADFALLDSLGAAVLLPVGRRSDTLAAFICLGQKRSGDVYTSTDLALLAAVADKASGELLRFDEAEIRRQARAMQDALRRYVPGSVAARVVSGQELEAGEREVTVFFVDIRGYTTYSEGRTAAEIFSTVNRYTETVSRVVRTHGGTIVEFNGDGMMAVFGAPEPLAAKERAAVTAGREVVAAVRALALGGAKAESRPLEVGVGIATGKAFVGNIHAVDRWIWSAIGNTTNLAARLQSLTRELDAAIVIDGSTWTAAGEVAAEFERHAEVPIRGRRQTEEVYVLPRAAATLRAQRSSAASA